jgi:polysaccharide deacetylase family protein (PEP-CTERM system associated)
VNALTVDVEDYFQVAAFADTVSIAAWDSYQPRIEQNTCRLLDVFGDGDCKATFFVLGWVAERFPKLVREIGERGHEIGCHGYTHQLIYEQTPKAFRQDTVRAKALLEDIVQQPVYGYRAASFSITHRSQWALDIIADAGFRYDSSVFPTRHDRYGLPGAGAFPHRITTPRGQTLIEFPLSTVKLLGYRLPVAGGGYFRLYPYAFTRAALRHINRSHKQPFVFYLHPWEIDPDQPRIPSGWLSRFRHYNNLDKCEHRLGQLLTDFEFLTVTEVLTELDLLVHEEPRVVLQ